MAGPLAAKIKARCVYNPLRYIRLLLVSQCGLLVRLQLIAEDEHIGRGFNSETDLVTRYSDNREHNGIAEPDSLRFLPG